MADRLPEELISAYLDGELSAADRRKVEAAFEQSAEWRSVRDDLVRLRNELQQLPTFKLPADFRDRVVRQLRETAPQPVVASRSKSETRGRWLFAGVVAAAAAIAFIIFGDWERDPTFIPTTPDSSELAEDGLDTSDWTQESLVYYRPDSPHRPLFSLVIDITLTRAGKANNAFLNAVNQAGIQLDPDLAVGDELQEILLASRMADDVVPTDDEVPGGEIEMTYVLADSATIDALWNTLRSRPGDFFPPPRLDLIGGDERNVMYQLNSSSRQQFAAQRNQGKKTLAHRLVFNVSLQSSLRLMGRVPSVALEANLEPTEGPTPDLTLEDFGLVAGEDPSSRAADDSTRQTAPASPKMSEVLFVLRYPPLRDGQ